MGWGRMIRSLRLISGPHSEILSRQNKTKQQKSHTHKCASTLQHHARHLFSLDRTLGGHSGQHQTRVPSADLAFTGHIYHPQKGHVCISFSDTSCHPRCCYRTEIGRNAMVLFHWARELLSRQQLQFENLTIQEKLSKITLLIVENNKTKPRNNVHHYLCP